MRSPLVSALGLVFLTGCTPPQFACEGDDQCTLAANGVCQGNARCSYPDPSCPSGQRYSEHAGPVGGQCVDASGSSTGTDSTDTGETIDPTTGSTTAVQDPCLMVDCGPAGTCEPSDGEPSCACDPGFVEQDLQCVEAGCPGTACLWVDAVDGDDANPGTSRDQPIRTLGRAGLLAPSLLPGEALVLRHGSSWDESLALTGLQGSEDTPIIVGTYDPENGETPLIQQGLTLDDSTGVRVENLRVTNPGGTALRLQGVSHTTVLGCETFEAGTGCILVRSGSEYTALVGNTARDCGGTYGIAVIEQAGGLGDHHWLVDNRIDGEGTINALNVTVQAADDVKTVRNYLRGSVDRGLHSRVGGHGWLVGNVIAQAGDANDAGLDHAGAGQLIARGNVLIDNALPVMLAGGGGQWTFNTVLHQGAPAVLTIPPGGGGWDVHDNLVLAAGAPVLAVPDAMDVTAQRNVYDEGCTFEVGAMVLDLAGWQALGQGARSRCEALPGLAVPVAIGSTHDWDDEGLLGAATPDAAWNGCAAPVGALGCDGTPLAANLPPFDDIGHGWPGPPEVQDRVELSP